ncbi:membrane metallo-endopeptidase-like 1 [Drosophila novamexicana]|uniref:membrane metallo-endopeptidase-like 1 n=1 Tax=Drosophila novamexicana TaxID=47314 RepID=UPI0011E59440|nr:membrane metallo-endopeptidase-like 1 [Drosophila novamexicana]
MSTPTSTCRICELLFILLWLSASGQAGYPPAFNPNTQLLNQILGYVNESVAACNDYYKYACGKWGEKHENDSFSEITGLIDHKVNENLIVLMNELQQRPLEPGSVEDKVLTFYQTCRQASESTRLSRTYLELVPPNEQIPWPQLKRRPDHWSSIKFQWMETLARLRRYGLTNVIFKLEVLPDLKNSSKYTVSIDRPYFEHKDQRLRGTLLTMLTLRMLGINSEKAWTLARKVKLFESAVRELVEMEYEEKSEFYEELSLQQLEVHTGGQWRKYLEIVLGRNVPADYVLQVENSACLTALMHLVNGWNREVVATYIMLHFVSYVQKETMQSDEPIECIQDVRRNMELATNLLYEQRFIGSDKLRQHQSDVLDLFHLLRQQFLKKLDANSLQLLASEVQMLRAKMLNMTINVGNMPNTADRTSFVKRYYADLHLAKDRNYALNHLRLLEFRTRRWFEQLDGALNATNFFFISDSETGMSSTPYYLLRQNIIIVPYGILQEPIFHHDAHDIFKVSLLGFMLSHELMHGFVSGGFIFDFRGNYNKLGKRIIMESEYSSGISCLNRNETDYLDEREADIAGIRLAYDVYFGPGSKFNLAQPSFTNLSLKQLFFLNLAQFFCGNTTPDDFADHDADELRLKQMLINFSAFAETHGCREDLDNMHPAQKCRLW